MAAALVSASQSSVIKLHWLTFGDTSVEPRCKHTAVFLILAATPEKKLRTKPQLIRFSTEHLEAVA